jgi:putative PIN family toxin of toxin-antitoxin system
MLKVVIDTNVIVSAALSPVGNPAKILNMIYDEVIQAYCSQEILAEYREVLSRKRLNIPIEIQNGIIDAIEEASVIIHPTASSMPLPDESDRVFYDVAKASGALLITGNIKHYPQEPLVVTPAEFVGMTDAMAEKIYKE